MFTLKLVLIAFLFSLGALNSFYMDAFDLKASAYAVIGASLLAVRAIPFKHPRVTTAAFNRFYDGFMVVFAFGAGWFGLAGNLRVAIHTKLAEMEASGQVTAPLGDIDLAFVIAVATALIFIPVFVITFFGAIKSFYRRRPKNTI